MTKKRIHLIYSIVLSASAVIAGICLMVACVGIYRSGNSPFTRDSIAAAFKTIAFPVYIFLALMIGGFILDQFLPRETSKPAVQKQYGVILEKLHRKLDLDHCDPALSKAIRKEQNNRGAHKFMSEGLLLVCSIAFLRYAVNIQYFTTEDINGSIIQAVLFFFLCLAIPFGYGVFAAYWNTRSIQKEITLVKAAIATGATAESTQNEIKKSNANIGIIVKYGILAVSLAILIYGFIAGGTADVLAKAAAICTECVGLG